MASQKSEWVLRLERLAAREGGFAYPWRSTIEEPHGEDAYTRLVLEHLRPELDVIEAGCGHGSDALEFAPRVRSYLGYDAVEPFIEICRRRAAAASLDNTAFVVADSSRKRAGRVPALDQSADLLITRRGPTNPVLDARRVCRPGAALIGLYFVAPPLPQWNDMLPVEVRMTAEPSELVSPKVLDYIERGGLRMHGCWAFDVPEWFDDPEQLLLYIAWNRELEFDEQRALDALGEVFAAHAIGGRVALRHRRFLWKAMVD
ncbi:MAG: class I SAM-dependent methyltransferase [Myxococcales bacterium]|nr:class I SAM-dependent methyltransferase [Myxococcales bacterium]